MHYRAWIILVENHQFNDEFPRRITYKWRVLLREQFVYYKGQNLNLLLISSKHPSKKVDC